ncbi:phage tail protein (plasmid) [Burkholderia sp. THE68]|uniref:phage tail protein n=1 Tax=Burkholderia sp. THE68 TaxID=758782 RepID=UPI00131622FD|nr:phage tail protein [Burkholderia sp. THE68]BBU33484.1 phage tail protein [Burkholderia sp. THE68]
MARIDPLRNFRYRLEIDNITQAGFSEVAIAETTIDAVDYREGTDPPHVRKLSGLTKYGSITLKAGMTVGASGLELFKWHSDVSAGQIKDKRKKVVIVVQDEAGDESAGARFVITDAWPIKYDPSDLNGKGNEVMIELLELANEGIERVK